MTNDEFLKLLGEGEWEILPGGFIRSVTKYTEAGNSCCPISWAYWKVTRVQPRENGPIVIKEYAAVLGLRQPLKIMNAADEVFSRYGVIAPVSLRKKLLKACHLV